MDNFDLRGYLAEGKLLKEEQIPNGWTEREPSDFSTNPEETLIKVWSAPMEGWDDEHKDIIFIKQGEDGKHYLDGYLAYSEFEGKGPFDSYKEALNSAIGEMDDIKTDWDEEFK